MNQRNYNIELSKTEAKDFVNNAFGLDLITIPNGDTLSYLSLSKNVVLNY